MSQINLFDVNEPVFRPANYKPVSKEEKLRRENEILKQAEAILVERYNQRLTGDTVSGVTDLFRIARTALAKEDMTRERFLGVYLNQRHKVIAVEVLFEGTIAAAAVYPREVVKRALELGAAGMAFAHNHPSGDPEPSGNDIAITKRLQTALDLVEIRVLDHIIVGTFDDYHSFAESGLL